MPEPSIPGEADERAVAPSAAPAASTATEAPVGEPDRSVMPTFEPLGNPRFGEPTMPGAGQEVTAHPYVSYARPIGPGHALAPPIVRGMVVTTVGVLLLSWLPGLGPFLAGLAGGWVARGWRGGLLASYIPGFLSSILFGVYYFLVPMGFANQLSLTSPVLAALLTTGMMIFTMAGGMLGGYLHSLRDQEPKGSRRRVQVG